MRKLLTLVIISIFILIVIKFKDLEDIFDFNELKAKFSTLSFFKKKITKISIIDNKNISKNYLLRSLDISKANEFLNYNRNMLKKRLEEINEIDNYMFELRDDGHLIIYVTEKKPLMVWIDNGKRKYVDHNGSILKY